MALDLPDRERAALASWRDELIADRDDLRPVREEALHVTLAFLGYKPEKEIPGIAEILEAAFAQSHHSDGSRRTELLPTGVVGIPRRRPRLFALSLADPDEAVAELQQALSDRLQAGGFYEPENRPFWPHVTLARVKKDRRAEAPDAAAPSGVLHASQITLYRSRLSSQGARYESLAAVPMG